MIPRGAKQIPDFPNYYATPFGWIYSSIGRGTWLSPAYNIDGYAAVGLRKNNKTHTRKIHRLVLETFVGPRPYGMECRHLNNNRSNNNINNLQWATPKVNQSDRVKFGTDSRGDKGGSAKLTLIDVRAIKCLYRTTKITQTRLAELYHVRQSTIGKIVNRKTWRHI